MLNSLLPLVWPSLTTLPWARLEALSHWWEIVCDINSRAPVGPCSLYGNGINKASGIHWLNILQRWLMPGFNSSHKTYTLCVKWARRRCYAKKKARKLLRDKKNVWLAARVESEKGNISCAAETTWNLGGVHTKRHVDDERPAETA